MSGSVLVVRGEQPDARVTIDRPRAHGMREAEFRLERPSMIAEVHNAIGRVLSQWRNHGDARAERHPPRRSQELGQRQRGRTAEPDGQLDAWVDEPGDVLTLRELMHLAGHGSPGDW